ncbi:MAG TPA: acetate/propionate family kinase [Pirellulales bacterium]|jgi:acetate kinase|nr:acetate/propionate family kinase [Pirellulales bacterium]
MKVLLLNAGSSSLKATLAESGTGVTLAQGRADWAGSATTYEYGRSQQDKPRRETVAWKGHAEAVKRFLSDLTRSQPVALADRTSLAAVGHRVVHGGEFTSSIRVTPDVRSRISALAELAPLHNPPSLEALAAAETALPGVPQVAVFDTAFHSTLPPEARTYPVPASWTRDWQIRRYGFHGLSHAYCSRRAAEMLSRDADQPRLVICHLGHGCSASAVRGGRCIDTTMGFTPLEGLMMATRSGSIDPSIVLHVQQQHGLTPAAVETALNHQSGLLGVSEVSADMREVLAAAREAHAPSQLALQIYCRRVRQAIGALAVTLGGIDALVFTAGVGERAHEIRESICAGLECLGLELDEGANARCTPDADIARRTSAGRILVIATREDLVMLEEVERVLSLN